MLSGLHLLSLWRGKNDLTVLLMALSITRLQVSPPPSHRYRIIAASPQMAVSASK